MEKKSTDSTSTQYHTALILIHRTFPTQLQSQTPSTQSGFTDLSTLSRNVCVHNAIRISEIVSQYSARYTLQRIFVTGLQHVGTAATALMAEISILQDGSQRERLLQCLGGLSENMKTMSETYQPAVLMTSVVSHFLRGPSSSETSTSASVPPLSSQANDGPIDPSLSRPPIATASSARTTRESTFPFLDSMFTKGTATPNMPQPPSVLDTSGGLPSLPSSWFEELDWEEDNEFLSLMGLKDFQGLNTGVGGGLMDGFDMTPS